MQLANIRLADNILALHLIAAKIAKELDCDYQLEQSSLAIDQTRNYTWFEDNQHDLVFAIAYRADAHSRTQNKLLLTRRNYQLSKRLALNQALEISESFQYEFFEEHHLVFYKENYCHNLAILLNPNLSIPEVGDDQLAQLWQNIKLRYKLELLCNMDSGQPLVHAVAIWGLNNKHNFIRSISQVIFNNLVIGEVMSESKNELALSLLLGEFELSLSEALKLKAGSEIAIECQFPLKAELRLHDQKWSDVEVQVEKNGLKLVVVK